LLCDLAERRRIDVRLRTVELRRIRQIENFCPKLPFETLEDETLEQ
jgi:hypothetical protein